MAGTIKYHYALDETGTLISVEDVCLEDRNKHRYTCLGCGAEIYDLIWTHFLYSILPCLHTGNRHLWRVAIHLRIHSQAIAIALMTDFIRSLSHPSNEINLRYSSMGICLLHMRALPVTNSAWAYSNSPASRETSFG